MSRMKVPASWAPFDWACNDTFELITADLTDEERKQKAEDMLRSRLGRRDWVANAPQRRESNELRQALESGQGLL